MDTIVSREQISNQARAAAHCYVQTGVKPAPIYPSDTAAFREFEASFDRWRHALTAVEDTESCA